MESPDQHIALCQQLHKNCHEILHSNEQVVGKNTNESIQTQHNLFAATSLIAVLATATTNEGRQQKKRRGVMKEGLNLTVGMKQKLVPKRQTR